MIFIYFGPPRTGKSYMFTRKINQLLREAKKNKDKGKPYRKVFSNYPVITKWGSSLKWDPAYVKEEIIDSDIFIDEAYQFFNSRNFKSFTSDEHSFFALNGHNSNNIYLIAHSPARLDTVIREMVNVFYYIKKVAIPFIDLPLWFRVEGYLDELALSQRYTNKNAVYSVEHCFFDKKIANTYNTQYFRKEGEFIKYPSWSEDSEFDEGKFLLNEDLRKDSMAVLSAKVFFWKILTYIKKAYKITEKYLGPIYDKIKPRLVTLKEKLKAKIPYKIKIEKTADAKTFK